MRKFQVHVALNSANHIGRPVLAELAEGYRAEQAAGETGACDVAVAMGQSRKSEHDVASVAHKAKDRVRLQAERCDELAFARVPEAVVDPEEESSGADPLHIRGIGATEAMRLAKKQCTLCERKKADAEAADQEASRVQ